MPLRPDRPPLPGGPPGLGSGDKDVNDATLDPRVGKSVLSELQRDSPPKHQQAQAEAVALVAKWDAQSAVAQRQPHNQQPGRRSRSNSRSRPTSAEEPLPPVTSASSNSNPQPPPLMQRRPPRPLLPSRGSGGPEPQVAKAIGLLPSCTDESLVSRMAARLAQVEAMNQQMSTKLALQAKEMEVLKSKLASQDGGFGFEGGGEGGGGGGDAVGDGCSGECVGSAGGAGRPGGGGGGDGGPGRISPAAQALRVEVGILRVENETLRTQVAQMAQFMADYGLHWGASPSAQQHQQQHLNDNNNNDDDSSSSRAHGVDNISSSSAAVCSGNNASYPRAPARPAAQRFAPDHHGRGGSGDEITVNIKVIQARVEGLNSLLEDDAAEVQKSEANGGLRLASLATAPKTTLPLTFFADGLKLSDWSFMSYTSPTTQKTIKEILDGYFPSLLKEEHPQGAPLKVIDRTGNAFKDWYREFSRTDPDLADGGDSLRVNLAAGRAMKAPAQDRSAAERLLAKLPEQVVRNGRVCDVRGAIAEKLGPSAGLVQGARLRSSSAPAADSDPNAALGSAPPSGVGGIAPGRDEIKLLLPTRDPSAPTARLQVKLETGHRITLTMEPHALLSELWAALEKWRSTHSIARAAAGGRQCSLRSAFPPRTYSDMSETLEHAGLTPSATLFVTVDVPAAT